MLRGAAADRAKAGAASSAESVCCDGVEFGTGRPLPDTTPAAVLVSFEPTCSLRNSYSILAPACARWPRATATSAPTSQASVGAAELLHVGYGSARGRERLNSADVGLRRGLRSAARQQHEHNSHPECQSQEKSHFPEPCFPAQASLPFDRKLAAKLETEVRWGAAFLSSFDANEAQIFGKFERSGPVMSQTPIARRRRA